MSAASSFTFGPRRRSRPPAGPSRTQERAALLADLKRALSVLHDELTNDVTAAAEASGNGGNGGAGSGGNGSAAAILVVESLYRCLTHGLRKTAPLSLRSLVALKPTLASMTASPPPVTLWQVVLAADRLSTSDTTLATRLNTCLEQLIKRNDTSVSSITTTNRLAKSTDRTSSNPNTSFFRNVFNDCGRSSID